MGWGRGGGGKVGVEGMEGRWGGVEGVEGRWGGVEEVGVGWKGKCVRLIVVVFAAHTNNTSG